MTPIPVPAQRDIETAFSGRVQLHDPPIRIGGQASVHRGRRTADGTGLPANEEIALKLYLDPSQTTRVDREIEAMVQIRLRTLANLLEYGSLALNRNQYPFLMWEFIEGEALDHRISRSRINAQTAAVIGRDVSIALAAIWRRRIVHRDVNPKNIMLRAGEQSAVLIDLGVAKYLDQTPLTAPGTTWGTRGYMSPEQCLGMDITCQSDVFSLGIALQEAIAGAHPTQSNQDQLVRLGGPRTSSIAPNSSAGLADILDRMVKRRPAHRPTPDVLEHAFSDLLGAI
jgi:serine/threonine-protein kinase